MKKNVLVILGQHRGGTSLLSGSLNRVGAYMGARYEYEADEYNEKGYYENAWIDIFNNEVLTHLGSTWHRVADIRPDWFEDNTNPYLTTTKLYLKNKLKDYISEDISNMPEGSFYLLKDPRISLILPLYLSVFEDLNLNPKFIFADRETEEIVNSLVHRDSLDSKEVRHSVEKHREYVERYKANIDILWTNVFSNMFYKPIKFLEYIKSFLQIPLVLTEETKAEVLQFVDQGLKHHSSDKSCKVISTYFGPRRTNIVYGDTRSQIDKTSNTQSTINLLEGVVSLERELYSGVFNDTIIVNHDISTENGDRKPLEYLERIDGTPTRSGVIKVLNRPWEQGIGASFKSFSEAFSTYMDQYKYWFFTEDNVIQQKGGYFKRAVSQLDSDPTVGFVCGYRYTSVENNPHPCPHCHGGCGASTREHLMKLYCKYGHLPYSPHPRENVNDQSSFNVLSAQWYRALEEEGEVMFTHKFLSEGLRIVDIDFEEPFCSYYGQEY